MNKSDETRLRQLAREYSNHVLSKREYRQARSEFIISVVNNSVSLPVNNYLPPLSMPAGQQNHDIDDATTQFFLDKDARLPEEIVHNHPPPSPPEETVLSFSYKPNKRFLFFFIIGAVGLVISTIIIKPDLIKGREIPKKIPPQATIELPEKKDGRALISDFLKKKDWFKQDLDDFTIEWGRLAAAQKEAVLNSIEAKQLSNVIYQRLLEERPLAAVNDGAALQRQQQLIDFAASIGINDVRFDACLPLTNRVAD